MSFLPGPPPELADFVRRRGKGWPLPGDMELVKRLQDEGKIAPYFLSKAEAREMERQLPPVIRERIAQGRREMQAERDREQGGLELLGAEAIGHGGRGGGGRRGGGHRHGGRRRGGGGGGYWGPWYGGPWVEIVDGIDVEDLEDPEEMDDERIVELASRVVAAVQAQQQTEKAVAKKP